MGVVEFLARSWCNLFVMEEAFKPLILVLNKNKSKTMVCTNKSWAHAAFMVRLPVIFLRA